MPKQVDTMARRNLVARMFTVRADTIDEKTRSVEAVLATEAPTLVFDFSRFELIDEVLIARGVSHADQVVMLESHQRHSLDSILGSVRDIREENGKVVGRLVFAEGDDAADRAWSKVRQGHLTDVSVGYRADEYVDIPPGGKQRVVGREFTAGKRTLRVTTKWTVREGSLVPIGADEAAKIRGDLVDQEDQARECVMDPNLRIHLESIGLERSASTEQAWAFMGQLEGDQMERAREVRTGKKEPAPKPKPTDSERKDSPEPVTLDPVERTVDESAVRKGAIEDERKRVAVIRGLAGEDVPEAIVQRAIDDGWSADRAGAAFLQGMRDAGSEPVPIGGPAIHSRSHDVDCTTRALGTGMLIRGGLAVIDPKASDEKRKEQERAADEGDRYSDMSMLDVCRESVRLDGGRMPHGRDDIIQRAVSGATLINIFTTTVNAALLSSYEEVGDTTGGWVSERDVPDFKSNERIMLDKNRGMKKLARGDSAKHATRSDKMEAYKIARFAEQFVVDDMDIIDDRFGALLDMPNEMGRDAARLRPDLVYAILFANAALNADSVALFHATHNNLITGSALASGTLKTAIKTMGIQQQNGVTLSVVPQYLLVPMELKHLAAELVHSATILLRGNTDTEFGSRNPIQDDNIQIIHDGRLDNGVTDPATETVYSGSGTTWYMMARGGRHTIEVGYLQGTGRRPSVRSFPLTEGKWGIGWDIKFDIGAKALDFYGVLKATA